MSSASASVALPSSSQPMAAERKCVSGGSSRGISQFIKLFRRRIFSNSNAIIPTANWPYKRARPRVLTLPCHVTLSSPCNLGRRPGMPSSRFLRGDAKQNPGAFGREPSHAGHGSRNPFLIHSFALRSVRRFFPQITQISTDEKIGVNLGNLRTQLDRSGGCLAEPGIESPEELRQSGLVVEPLNRSR